jgi:CheY-like chemotaxis protein
MKGKKMPKEKLMSILMADDDVDDCAMAEEALAENHVANPFKKVRDGKELMDYLNHLGDWESPGSSPRPCLILLDLNMPKIDGREALKLIKADEHLRRIPVVILTTSSADEDIVKSYDMGANSFVTKPVTFEGLLKVIRTFKDYWLEIVELPPGEEK